MFNIRNISKRCLFIAILIVLIPITVFPASEKPGNTGTFFSVDENVIDQVYYLEMTKPPQIKQVVFAPGNKPQAIVGKGGSFDLSQDGRMLVYSFNDRLRILRVDRAAKPIMTRGDGARPKWSPNGELDRKSTRLNSSHIPLSRMPSSA